MPHERVEEGGNGGDSKSTKKNLRDEWTQKQKTLPFPKKKKKKKKEKKRKLAMCLMYIPICGGKVGNIDKSLSLLPTILGFQNGIALKDESTSRACMFWSVAENTTKQMDPQIGHYDKEKKGKREVEFSKIQVAVISRVYYKTKKKERKKKLPNSPPSRALEEGREAEPK